MLSHRKMTGLTLSILLGLTVPTYANSSEGDSIKTPEVVVTATRTEEEVKNIPNSVEVITHEDIEKLGATDIYSALRLADNVNIVSNGSGFGHRISIRGMATNQALILIDGRRTATEDTSTTQNLLALDRINISNVERIEIVRGAASAQYGSDALSGVINIITKKSTQKSSAMIGVSTGTESINNYYHIDLGKQGKFSGTFDMNFGKDRKRMMSNSMSYLYGPKQNYNFNGTYELDEDNNLNLSIGYFDSDLKADWGKLGDAILNSKRWDYNLSLDGKTDKSNYTISTYYSKLDKDRYLPYQKFVGEGMENNKYSIWGIDAKNTVEADENHLITYGGSFVNNKVDGINFGKTKGSKETDTLSGYIQDEWTVDDKLLLIPAVRLDYHSDFGNKVTPKVGATYFLKDNSRFKFNWGKGFRAPTVSELYMDYTHMGQITMGNPNLQPEESTNWDFSYEAELDGNFGKITYFNNHVDNMLNTRRIDRKSSEYYNLAGLTKTDGIELTLGRNFDENWSVKATSNWTNASNNTMEAVSTAHGVDGIADNISTLQLSYDDNKDNGYNYTLWNEWVSGYYDSSKGKDYTYNTLNFVVNKKFGKGNRVYAGLDNIFNKKEGDINLDGRIWRLGAEFMF